MSEINPDSKESEIAQNLFAGGVNASAKLLIALGEMKLPFLKLPIINQLFCYVINKMAGKVSGEGELHISFKFIDDDGAERNGQYKDSLERLNQVEADPTATQEQKDEALNETIQHMGNAIRFPRR